MKDAEEKLAAVFDEIARSRMAGLPICNPALRVQVVGFREWQGRWLGVLVTPWTINLILLPGEDAPLVPLVPDERKTWEFPSGSYEFMGLNVPELGVCHFCPLVSPTLDIATHEDAVSISEELMVNLFASDQLAEMGEEGRNEMIGSARSKGEPIVDKTLSRRDFLRGAFLRS